MLSGALIREIGRRQLVRRTRDDAAVAAAAGHRAAAEAGDEALQRLPAFRRLAERVHQRIGEWLEPVRRDPEAGGGCGQDIDRHDAPDPPGMAGREHQRDDAAHRMADHRWRRQPRRADIADKLFGHTGDHRSHPVAARRLAGKARHLHQMPAMARQRADQPVPHRPAVGEAGDQHHVRPLAPHPNADPLRTERKRLVRNQPQDAERRCAFNEAPPIHAETPSPSG